MYSESEPKLNLLGKVWFAIHLAFVFLFMGLAWLWALPGLALDWIFIRVGYEDSFAAYLILTFWLGPLWLFLNLVSKPSKGKVPKWAKKKEKK